MAENIGRVEIDAIVDFDGAQIKAAFDAAIKPYKFAIHGDVEISKTDATKEGAAAGKAAGAAYTKAERLEASKRITLRVKDHLKIKQMAVKLAADLSRIDAETTRDIRKESSKRITIRVKEAEGRAALAQKWALAEAKYDSDLTRKTKIESSKRITIRTTELAKQKTDAVKLAADLSRIDAETTRDIRKESSKRITIRVKEAEGRAALAQKWALAEAKYDSDLTRKTKIESSKRITIRTTELAKQKTAAVKLAADLSRIDARTTERIRLEHEKRVTAATRAAIRQRERLQKIAERPILINVVHNLERVNAAFSGFNNVVRRVFRGTLVAITAWNASVIALTAGAAAAAISSFAKVELAAARAGAVFASDKFAKSIEAGNGALKNFAGVAEQSSARVIAASNEIAKTTLFNPAEVAEGAKALAQAGFSERNALQELGTVARFAQNEQIDLAEATAQLTGGLHAAGLETSKLTELTDKFTRVANTTNATASQVAQAFSNQAAGAFRSYGQSVDEALTTIGLFAKANLTGLEAGTQTANLIREINRSATIKAADVWKKYGIAIEDAQGKAIPFSVTLSKLVNLLETTRIEKGPEAYQKLRKELDLTERSMRGLTIIQPQVAKLGIDGVERIRDAVASSAGDTKRQSEVLTNTITQQFQNMLENIQIAFQQVGQRAKRPLISLFNSIDDVVQSSIPSMQRLGDRLAEFVASAERFFLSDAFRQGAKNISEAFGITISGLKDSGDAFSEAFAGDNDPKSFFESFTEALIAFSKFSAAVLPETAKVFGTIFRVIRDHKEEVAFFAKMAFGVFLLSNAMKVFLVPVGRVIVSLSKLNKWLGAMAAAEGLGGLSGLVSKLAKNFGFASKSSTEFLKVGASFSKLLGPVGLVVAAIEVGIGFVKGFNEEFEKSALRSDEFKDALIDIAPLLDMVKFQIETSAKALGLLSDALIFVGESAGASAAKTIADIVIGLGNMSDAIRELKDLNFAGATIEWTKGMARFGKHLPIVGQGFEEIDKQIKEMNQELDKSIDSGFEFTEKYVKNMKKQRDAVNSFNNELSKTTAASIFADTMKKASNQTQKFIDLYTKAAGDDQLAKNLRDLMGIDQATAQSRLVGKLQAQLTQLQGFTFTEFNRKLGEAATITPQIKQEALQTIGAQIKVLQQKRKTYIELGLEKNQTRMLVGAVNKEIIKLRSFVSQNPVTIGIEIAGTEIGRVGAPISPEWAENMLVKPIQDAIKDPRLVSKLSDAQRELYEKATKQVRGGGMTFDVGIAGAEQTVGDFKRNADNIALALANLDNLRKTDTEIKKSQKNVSNEFYSYAKSAAEGLLLGSKNSQQIAASASTIIAKKYLTTFQSFFGIASPSIKMMQQGIFLMQGLKNGITIGLPLVLAASLDAGIQTSKMLANGITIGQAFAISAATKMLVRLGTIMDTLSLAIGAKSGNRVMTGFLDGMKKKFGDADNMGKDTIAYYLHKTIPALITELKGPVSYDATILVPAGEAIMDGLDRGLRTGFGTVEEFLRRVGPSMEEFVPDSVFSDATKQFMVDVAMGDTPNPDDFFAEFVPEQLAAFSGTLDPTLSFLHKTLSLLDTQQMASHLAALYGLTVTSTDRAAGTLTSSGQVSDHTFGTAADLSGSTSGMDSLVDAISPLYNTIFKQIIWRNKDVNRGFFVPDHMDHVHAAWLKGDGFSKYSERIGTPPVIDFPGASDIVDQAISIAANETGVTAQLIAAIAKQESGFNPSAVSPAGAAGLMQLMPDTAAGLGVSNVFDPGQNALGGARYIRQMQQMFNNNLELALAAYNAGPRNVQSYGGIPPFPETQEYVRRVLENLRAFGGFREHGGAIDPGKFYVAGERGPEFIAPTQRSMVFDAKTTQAMAAMVGSGGFPSGAPQYNDNRQITVHTNASDTDAIRGIYDAHTSALLGGVSIR